MKRLLQTRDTAVALLSELPAYPQHNWSSKWLLGLSDLNRATPTREHKWDINVKTTLNYPHIVLNKADEQLKDTLGKVLHEGTCHGWLNWWETLRNMDEWSANSSEQTI